MDASTSGSLFDRMPRASLIVCIISVPVCTLSTALRFLATRRSGRPIGAEDWLALSSLVFLFGMIACILAGLYYAAQQSLHGNSMALDIWETRFKLLFASSLFWPPNQTAAKLSLLLLYHRIFGVNRTAHITIIAIGAVQLAWTLVAMFGLIFQCTPVYGVWTPDHEGRCMNTAAFLSFIDLFNSLIDFSMIIVAVMILRRVQIRTSRKWKVAVLFATGGLAGIIGILASAGLLGYIKIGMMDSEGYKHYNDIALGLWALLQSALTVICCCAPTFPSLLVRPHNGDTPTGSTSSSASTSSTSKKSSGLLLLDQLYSKVKAFAWSSSSSSSRWRVSSRVLKRPQLSQQAADCPDQSAVANGSTQGWLDGGVSHPQGGGGYRPPLAILHTQEFTVQGAEDEGWNDKSVVQAGQAEVWKPSR